MINYPLGADSDTNCPWHEKETYYKTCPYCNGSDIKVSDCCGAEPQGNRDCDTSDFGICPECHEHCEYVSCEYCNGTGEIPMTDEEIRQKEIDEIIANREIQNDI